MFNQIKIFILVIVLISCGKPEQLPNVSKKARIEKVKKPKNVILEKVNKFQNEIPIDLNNNCSDKPFASFKGENYFESNSANPCISSSRVFHLRKVFASTQFEEISKLNISKTISIWVPGPNYSFSITLDSKTGNGIERLVAPDSEILFQHYNLEY